MKAWLACVLTGSTRRRSRLFRRSRFSACPCAARHPMVSAGAALQASTAPIRPTPTVLARRAGRRAGPGPPPADLMAGRRAPTRGRATAAGRRDQSGPLSAARRRRIWPAHHRPTPPRVWGWAASSRRPRPSSQAHPTASSHPADATSSALCTCRPATAEAGRTSILQGARLSPLPGHRLRAPGLRWGGRCRRADEVRLAPPAWPRATLPTSWAGAARPASVRRARAVAAAARLLAVHNPTEAKGRRLVWPPRPPSPAAFPGRHPYPPTPRPAAMAPVPLCSCMAPVPLCFCLAPVTVCHSLAGVFPPPPKL